jgi:hypothetical protein
VEFHYCVSFPNRKYIVNHSITHTMFSKIVPFAARTAAARSALAAPASVRGFATVFTAGEAAALSGYSNIEFRINEDAMVIDAVQQFAANNIGCMVTVNDAGT